MITLGALLVGLLLLLVLLGVLAWMQRRPRRGPEQPRTVADLVRMREAAKPRAVPADDDPAPEAVDRDPTQADAVPEPAEAAPDACVSRPELPTADEQAPSTGPAIGAASSPPEDAAVDTPWARAARMAEPMPEWSAESDEAEPSTDTPARASIALPPTGPPGRSETPEPASSAAAPSAPVLPEPVLSAAAAPSAPALPEPGSSAAAAPSPAVLAERALTAPPLRPGASPPAPDAAAVPFTESAPDAVVPAEASRVIGQAAPLSAPLSAPSSPAGVATAPSALPDVVPPPRGEALMSPPVADPAEPQTTPTVPAPGVAVPPAQTVSSDVENAADAATSAPPEPAVLPAGTAPHLPTNGHGGLLTPARVARRARRSPAATAAEQAAADLALLRTFGVTRPAADEPEVALEGCATDADEPVEGTAQPVAVRVLARSGRGISGATVTLLDDHGRETASTRTDSHGHGTVTARHPGGYMMVAAADGYQPGAITVAVTDEPVDAEIPLTRSASITGIVSGEDGPIVGAQLALVQDGEIVDTAQSAADGTYRFRDLAAGEYGLSATAHECEPAALVLKLVDEAELRQDVELVPAGLPSDDVMIGRR